MESCIFCKLVFNLNSDFENEFILMEKLLSKDNYTSIWNVNVSHILFSKINSTLHISYCCCIAMGYQVTILKIR